MNAGSAWVVAPCCAGCARRRDRLRQRLPEVEPLEQDLQHRRDDRRAARASRVARTGAPSRWTIVGAIDERGRLPPSAGFGWPSGRVEVGQLVVDEEAPARHDDAVAAGRLDRERVGDDRALARRRRSGASSMRSGWSPVGRSPRRRRRRCRAVLRIDQRGALGRERVSRAGRAAGRRRTPGRRGTRRGRRTRSATPRGTSGYFCVVVERVPARRLLEDVERLADRRAARGRRAHAVDVEPAVVDVRRLALGRRVVAQVAPSSSARAARRGWRRRSAAAAATASTSASAIGPR